MSSGTRPTGHWKALRWPLAATAAYLLLYVPIFGFFGAGGGAAVTLPVMAFGWFGGLRAGVIAGILAFPLNTLLLNTIGELGWDAIIRLRGFFPHATLPIIGAAMGMASRARDRIRDEVVERRRAEHDLVSSQARLQALLDAIPDAIFRFRDDGTIVDYTPGREHPMEMPSDTVVGRDLDEVFPSDVAVELRAAMRRARQEGGVRRHDYRLTVGGAIHNREARIISVGAREVLAVVRDTTERRRLEDELMLADRMASVGSLAAGVAHEINNPLAFMAANLDLLAELLGDLPPVTLGDRGPQALALLQESREGTQRITRTVRDLKTFSRGAENRPVLLNANEILESAIGVVWNQIKHRGRLVRQLRAVPMITADAARLGQVFLNLLVNATQAWSEDGLVDNVVRVRSGTDDKGRVVVEVEDNGVGIKSDDLSRIFDPFFTTKPVGVGTGLGLSISHRIITDYGGELTVDSTIGTGSTFRVTLQAAAADGHPAPVRSTVPAPTRPPAVPRRILIVDDDPLVAAALKRLLSGHSVTIATGGTRALEVLRQGDLFDLIFCDVMMPQITGMDVHREVEQEQPETASRFVFMTGGAFSPRAQDFLDRVDNPVVEKPFDPERIRSVVEEGVGAAAGVRGEAPSELKSGTGG